MLKVIAKGETNKSGHITYACECECGNLVQAKGVNLRSGKTVNCGAHKGINKDGTSKKLKGPVLKDNTIDNAVFNTARGNAKKRGYSFHLNQDEYFAIAKNNCYYCNRKPEQITYAKARGICITNGVDRVDNSIHYTRENCVPCCKICNISKNSMRLEEWISWIKDISGFLASGNHPAINLTEA